MPRATLHVVVLGTLIAALLTTADVRARPQASREQARDQGEMPRFRVGVDAVRIDAVVTDRDNRIVEDLTADDFEIKQDGKRQRVTFAQFMPVAVRVAAAAEAKPRATGDVVAPIAAPPRRSDVQRTLVVIVDDLSLSFESLYYARRGLRAFVERELLPSDLVALVRTGGSLGSLQSFTTDRRVLHSAIDGLQWNFNSRSGIESFESIEPQLTKPDRTALSPNDFESLNQLRRTRSAAGTLGALSLAVRGTRDLPGRKAIILMTEGFQLFVKEEHTAARQLDTRLRTALDRVIDQATRAGVVIYALDSRGLQTGGLQASDNFTSDVTSQMMTDAMMGAALDRSRFNRDTQEGMAYLAEQTGGFAVRNTNDLGAGLGRITNDIRGYYIIGYTPEAGTFAAQGKTPQYRKLTIDVKRPGLRIRTRKEFLGVSDPPVAPTPSTPAEQLVHAATSPFGAADLSLRATVLPGYSKELGTFVRTLLHVDARGLTFTAGDDGRRTASADVLGMVFDHEGSEMGHLSTGFSVALTNEGADEALRDGLAYVLSVPIARPGGYQVRFAIRDRTSGALGSAGEFVQIDDIGGGAFALSGILLRRGDRAAGAGFGAPEQIAIAPEQARAVFQPGGRLSYAYEVYNAAAVQTVVSLWRGAERVFAAPPDSLQRPASEPRVFAAAGGLGLGERLPPGNYVLQVAATATDGTRSSRRRIAVQRATFDVEAPSR